MEKTVFPQDACDVIVRARFDGKRVSYNEEGKKLLRELEEEYEYIPHKDVYDGVSILRHLVRGSFLLKIKYVDHSVGIKYVDRVQLLDFFPNINLTV